MPRPDDYDDDDPPRRRGGAEFPPGVKAAGMIWIGFGVLGLVGQVINLVMSMGNAAAGGPGGAGAAPSPYVGVGCGVLFALVFLMFGIESLLF